MRAYHLETNGNLGIFHLHASNANAMMISGLTLIPKLLIFYSAFVREEGAS